LCNWGQNKWLLIVKLLTTRTTFNGGSLYVRDIYVNILAPFDVHFSCRVYRNSAVWFDYAKSIQTHYLISFLSQAPLICIYSGTHSKARSQHMEPWKLKLRKVMMTLMEDLISHHTCKNVIYAFVYTPSWTMETKLEHFLQVIKSREDLGVKGYIYSSLISLSRDISTCL
jgi:hypothetical protein